MTHEGGREAPFPVPEAPMTTTPRLLLSTGNAGKVREIRAILGDTGWEIVTPREAGVALAAVAEGGRSYTENAISKAVAAANASGLPDRKSTRLNSSHT